jgi:branched-chain amino acid transport system permease protein
MMPIWVQLLGGQLLIGLINGAFYSLLSVGLAIIFGMLNIINFLHGTLFMMGAFIAYIILHYLGLGYWWALALAPLTVGLISIVLERFVIRRVYGLDPLYGLLVTFALALITEGLFRIKFGSAGLPYPSPRSLAGGVDLKFVYLPYYRIWIVLATLVICSATWLLIEKTRLGSMLRAATENPDIVQTFGVNVPLMLTLTYGVGAALAAFTGVMAAPIYTVSSGMGGNYLAIIFAVVVIGGMGSIMGAIVSGFSLGVIEALTKLAYPEASATVVFAIMVVVLLIRPQGLFGRNF